MTATTGILALEGDWTQDLRNRGNVRPFLQLMDEQAEIKSIHRDVGTTAELAHYAQKWQQSRYKSFDLVYLAFHGDPGALWVGDEQITLERLAELLGKSCRGRVVHFGSCSTVRVTEQRLAAFKRQTGAVAVSGYRKPVDWLESCAFEMLLIGALGYYTSRGAAVRYLQKSVPELAARLGWQCT
jgi:hypothetical protein